MSNYLSIAMVTAALQGIIEAALFKVVDGAEVRIWPPRATGAKTAEVSLYLYHLTPNAQMRNGDLPTRGRDGGLIDYPQVALELHYVIIFSGEDQLQTERMLGRVATILHANSVLTAEVLEPLMRPDGAFPFLASADLPKQREQVKITPEYLTLEELTKLWTVFFQMAHRPSLHYVASPLLLDAEVPPQLGAPLVLFPPNVSIE